MKKSLISSLHLVFWLIVIALNLSFLVFSPSSLPLAYYFAFGFKMLLQVGAFYLTYSLLLPRLVLTKRYSLMAGWLLVFLLCYIPFYAASLTFVDIQLGLEENWQSIRSLVIPAVYYTIFYVLLGGMFRLAVEGLHNRQQKIQMERLQVNNELALLRSQINPHFLFNTLNTIHSYILSQNPNSARAVIMLSDIMRYMLYDAGREKITLSQELEYLKSLISLHDFRFEKPGLATFNIEGNPDGILIPPMLLTPFVENAFKHGHMGSNLAGIDINLSLTERKLTFRISNQVNPVSKENLETGEGMGLSNVKRRLELLFPGKYSLHIFDERKEFKVELELLLT